VLTIFSPGVRPATPNQKDMRRNKQPLGGIPEEAKNIIFFKLARKKICKIKLKILSLRAWLTWENEIL
jgi:hypothetical protein